MELSRVRDRLSDLTALGARVVGISMDSMYSHDAFSRSLRLNFPLLSDWSREAMEAFGILDEERYGYRPLNARAAFVVDREGVVRWARVDRGIVHPDELVEALAELGNRS